MLEQEAMLGCSLFHRLVSETGSSCLPTVVSENDGIVRWLEKADLSLCRLGTSVTRVKYNDR